MGEIKKLKIKDLLNYFENPRHVIGTNEVDTLKKLFNSVGVQYMLNLADDIQKNGLLGNQQIVVVYSNDLKRYVVYEGNRRVAVLKLLLEPDKFSFLDVATKEKAQKISQKGNISEEISCYVTNEKDAFFIMERLHSGEDKGKGTKQWSAREKENFKVRMNHEKTLSYLVDFYVKKYFADLDITNILPFTTIERIFNNRVIKRKIGLDVSDEETFTKKRMQLVIDASKWVVKESENEGIAVTRLFNKAGTIEDKLLPWLSDYNTRLLNEEKENLTDEIGSDSQSKGITITKAPKNDEIPITKNQDPLNVTDIKSVKPAQNNIITTQGNTKNLPYFFQGLNYSNLLPSDVDSHGVAAICKELELFSEKKLVKYYPIATTFLVRAIIEQAIIYYSKKHTIQGSDQLIWSRVQKDSGKLSRIIDNYNKNLANYITDVKIRDYFNNLFKDYSANVDPLNWVIHRPAEFRLDANTLIELPRKGLLTVINYLLSNKV